MHNKNPYVGSHVYGNVVVDSVPQEPAGLPVGMYDEMCALRNRLASINSQLESALHRMYGPRPQAASGTNDKNPEQPSLILVSLQVGKELQHAEAQIAEIVNFIG